MLKALYYIHKVVKIIHRDIKPDNIMVNHYGEAVLIDFGLSLIIDHLDDRILNKAEGSVMFFAPEMLLKKEEKEKILIKGE